MPADPHIEPNTEGPLHTPPAGPPSTPRPKRRGCLTCGAVALFITLAVGRCSWIDLQTHVAEMHGISSLAQVRITLRQYAETDGMGLYPDGRHPEIASANALFRELFKAEIVTDESGFTCRGSSFRADNVIGTPPDFAEAVAPGECHWMVLKHQSSRNHGKTPLIIENAEGTAWPPRWKIPAWWRAWLFGMEPKPRGFALRNGGVIVGRIDGSMTLEKLRPDGTLDWHSPNNLDEHGKSWIDNLTPDQIAKLEYWDVEEKQ